MPQGFKYLNVNATTAGTLIKTGAGVLHAICVNQKSGTSTDTMTVYDNTAASGTIIGTINLSAGQDVLLYDVAFQTGLEVKCTITATADLTIVYL